MSNVNNTQDIIDSREVIDRIEELKEELLAEMEVDWEEKQLEEKEAEGTDFEPVEFEAPDLDEGLPDGYDTDELASLLHLQERCEGYASDWRYGETLIRDSYFEEYAKELADDIGAIPKDARWPCNCIDWSEAAEELKQDYTEVDYSGISYWIRCS